MKRFLNKHYYFLVSLLVLFDQVVKIIIDRNYRDVTLNIIPNIIIYKPVLNDKFSWINSALDLDIGRKVHIILMVLAGVLIFLAFNYSRNVKADSNNVLVCFIFLIAGIICSTIDKIFWGGSLDFIRIEGFFTFDIKDCYLTIVEIIILVNLKKLKSFKVRQFYNYIIGLIRG